MKAPTTGGALFALAAVVLINLLGIINIVARSDGG